jgi:LysR family nitrogen assimilation transcriptional regulator
MDLRQLKYFSAVALHENFSKASQELHIAQPALSKHVRALEQELGVTLFERHLRGATLTAKGRALRDRSDYLLRSVEQLRRDMQEQPSVSGPIVLGMSPNAAAVAGATVAAAVMQAYPDVQLKIVEAFSPALNEMLLSGQADIALVNGVNPSSPLALEPICRDALCLIGLADDPRLRVPQLDVRDLASISLVFTGMSGAGVRNELEMQASKRRIALNSVLEVDSITVARQFILRGTGCYTVYIASGVEAERRAGLLKSVPIKGLWIKRMLAWPTDRPMPLAAQHILPVMRMAISELISAGGWVGSELLPRRRSKTA